VKAIRDSILEARALSPKGVWLTPGQRILNGLYWLFGLAAFLALCASLDVTPEKVYAGLSKLTRFASAMFPPTANGDEVRILLALLATIAMAVAGTTIAVVISIPLGVIGAKSIVRNGVVHFSIRRIFDLFRGIPSLVWALILVSAFGLGPFAGVIALALSDIPRLGKQYAEAIENADLGPSEGIFAAGGGSFLAIRFGLAPQVVPVMLSQSLYTLESNFRNAAILGIVGAGGIGQELEERIRVYAFDEVAWITIAYVACVFVLDWLSERIRTKLA
jgi:phosphonate transport system permease protein